jgi:regulator of protease activity HflC (stomatin/prohibitin superfamily)
VRLFYSLILDLNGAQRQMLCWAWHLALARAMEENMYSTTQEQKYKPSHKLSVKAMVYGLGCAVCLVSGLSALATVPAGHRAVLIGDDIWKMHRAVGPSYVDKVIRPESRTVVRNVVSSYAVTEVYSTKRKEIQAQLEDQMSKTLARNFIALDGLLIRNISFTEAFAQAVENKQVAMQEAERMKYVLQKEESEKDRKIIAATGEAEAIRRRGRALHENPLLIQYEYVEKISPNIKAIVADQKTIMGMGLGSLMGEPEKK